MALIQKSIATNALANVTRLRARALVRHGL
jgi:hypothetical protein